MDAFAKAKAATTGEEARFYGGGAAIKVDVQRDIEEKT